MKPKRLSKHLSINKKTISDLNGRELVNIKGGHTNIGVDCVASVCYTACYTDCEYSCGQQTCNGGPC